MTIEATSGGLPAGSCDCHIHVFEDAERYPFATVRSFTPGGALLDSFLQTAGAVGIDRAVIVQPSVYGTDNSCLADAIARFPDRLRGIAVIDAQTTDDTLQHLQAGGVRGIRLNLVSTGAAGAEAAQQAIEEAARRALPLGWHLQLFMRVALLDALEEVIRRLPVDVVFDHMGFPDAKLGVGQPGFAALQRLLAEGRCWVKLAGVYHVAEEDLGNSHVDRLARHLVMHFPERLLWGSDWPHIAKHARKIQAVPERVGFRDIRYASLVALLEGWVDDSPSALEQILVRNPVRLYGFAEPRLS